MLLFSAAALSKLGCVKVALAMYTVLIAHKGIHFGNVSTIAVELVELPWHLVRQTCEACQACPASSQASR